METVSPNPELIEKLKQFCEADDQSMWRIMSRQYFDGNEGEARSVIDIDQIPALVVPSERLQRADGIDYDILRGLPPDRSSPFFQHWFALRQGKASVDTLSKTRDLFESEADKYAAATVGIYEKLRKLGFVRMEDYLTKIGITRERLNELFTATRQLKDKLMPEINEAGAVGGSQLPSNPGLFTADQMQAAINNYIAGGVVVRRREGIPPNIATTYVAARITDQNNAEVRSFMIAGLETDPSTMAHELAHAYAGYVFSADLGDIPSAVSGLVEQEQYARLVGGVDQKEALFFASCVEDAYRFGQRADQLLGNLTDEEIRSEQTKSAVRDLIVDHAKSSGDFQTGLRPVPGSGFVFFGPYMIPYGLGVAGAGAKIETARKLNLTNPKDLLTQVVLKTS